MANDAGTPIPVWGIDVGSGVLHAVRTIRRDGGGFDVLAYEEVPAPESASEALIAYLKRKALKKHPLVVAQSSPSARLLGVHLSPDLVGMDDEDTRAELLELIHPEPDEVEFRHLSLGEDHFLVSAEDRGRVEGMIAALEGAGITCYGLTTSLQTMFRGLRETGLFTGDGVLIRVQPRWSDVLIVDGLQVIHQGIPIGSGELADDAGRQKLAGDVARLLDFRRSRAGREKEEEEEEPAVHRFLVVGLEKEVVAALAPHLPGELFSLSAESGKVRGRGRITTERALEIVALAPGAFGASISGAASPRRLQLAYRDLPATLSLPRGPTGTFVAAAAVVLLAVFVTWFGLTRDVAEVRDALARLEKPRMLAPTPEDLARLETMSGAARRLLSMPLAAERILEALPEAAAAPYETSALEISGREDGGFDAHLAVTFEGLADDLAASRIAGYLKHLDERFLGRTKIEPHAAGVTVHIRFAVEGDRP
jgi:HAMP domain-containing protein